MWMISARPSSSTTLTDLLAVDTHLAMAAVSLFLLVLSKCFFLKSSIVAWLWWGGSRIGISCVLCHQVVFQTGHAMMIAQFTTTKDTDHFGLVNGTIWQLFKSKPSIQNLIGIHFGVSCSPSTQNVTCLLLLGSTDWACLLKVIEYRFWNVLGVVAKMMLNNNNP